MKTVASIAFAFALTVVPCFSQTTGSAGGGQAAPNRQPTIAVQYYILNSGVFPSSDPGFDFVDHTYPLWGEIRAISFDLFIPAGMIPCDGRLLPIANNAPLFSIVGTTYGGNGTTTFAMPDLRGTVPIGAGQGPGLPNYNLGQRDGTENYAFTTANLPAHIHTAPNGPTGSTGSGATMDNLQPSLAINFCIATNGEIILYPAHFAPHGWRFCDGSLIQISQYPTLYACIGTNYGGDGVTTFALPDLRGRAPISAGAGSTYNLGQTNGAATTVLTLAQMPAHVHSLNGGSTGLTGGSAPFDTRQPTLGLTWLLSTDGYFPSSSGSESGFPMLGELRLVAGNATTLGDGWVPADGAQLQINDDYNLFSIIGTTYGGDGDTVFNVPDLRGRLTVNTGQSSGTSSYNLGDTAGSETYTLTFSMMPAHTHTVVPAMGLLSPAGSPLVNGSSTVDFGSALYRTAGLTKTFYITNTGNAHLTLGTVTVDEGTNGFVVSALGATDLAP
ncbi:MAG TPA: tail fiber protein, partial [Candidatus Acidoferrales bacterium]|nr:tail fiber protein [Candidatus Acidoferrales bacterium]